MVGPGSSSYRAWQVLSVLDTAKEMLGQGASSRAQLVTPAPRVSTIRASLASPWAAAPMDQPITCQSCGTPATENGNHTGAGPNRIAWAAPVTRAEVPPLTVTQCLSSCLKYIAQRPGDS